MRISDWSSDVCSSDLPKAAFRKLRIEAQIRGELMPEPGALALGILAGRGHRRRHRLVQRGPALETNGKASGKGRVRQYVYISVVAVSLKKKNTIQTE